MVSMHVFLCWDESVINTLTMSVSSDVFFKIELAPSANVHSAIITKLQIRSSLMMQR